MEVLLSELAIGELTAVFCAIIFALIPLTIWLLSNLERQKDQAMRAPKSIRARTY